MLERSCCGETGHGLARGSLSAALALAAVCCGGGDATAPPSPSPVDAGLLHVVEAGAIVTYRIDGARGRLTKTGSEDLPSVATIAGQPTGRFLYAGVASTFDGSGGGVTSFAVDATTGTLTKVVDVEKPDCSGTSWDRQRPHCQWLWLAAGTNRLYGMWRNDTYHDWYFSYVSYALEGDGRLAPGYQQEFFENLFARAAIDVDLGLFYNTSGAYGEGASPLVAYAIESGGSLRQTATNARCDAVGFADPAPLAAGGGKLFVAADIGGSRVVCSYDGTRLESRGSSPFPTFSATEPPVFPTAYLGATSTQPALLAVYGGTPGQPDLRVFSVSAEGRIESLYALPGPARPLQDLLFHPSGQWLFALDVDGAVQVFALGATEGHAVATVPGSDDGPNKLDGHGRMIVTLPRP